MVHFFPKIAALGLVLPVLRHPLQVVLDQRPHRVDSFVVPAVGKQHVRPHYQRVGAECRT